MISSLFYLDSQFFFNFDILKEKHYTTYSPGYGEVIYDEYTGSWDEQLRQVDLWLSYLQREVEQPDLWADISRYQLPDEDRPSPEQGNEPFTAYQAERISETLDKVKIYIESEIKLNAEQSRFVAEKLEYLTKATKRQGKLDWYNTCIGVLVTISTSLVLAPEQTKAIWALIKESIVGVIKLLTR